MPDPTARLSMFLYHYSFHHDRCTTECETLAEAVGLAISDVETGDAWPTMITSNGAELWQCPDSLDVDESLYEFARGHGIPNA